MLTFTSQTKLPIVECVLNVSTSDHLIIAQIESTLNRERRVFVLHVDGSRGTNRTVFTIVGVLSDLQRRLEALIKELAQRININNHAGIHPHIGVLDVIPFIPIANIAIDELKNKTIDWCLKISEKFDLPCFFYGELAKKEERRALYHFRKGGLERLKIRLEQGLKPDTGPLHLHSTLGASCVAVRDFMGAFNINLNTSDLSTAKELVKQILNKRQGYRGIEGANISNVKFLAWLIPEYNCCQISTNVYRLDEINLLELYLFVSEEAAKINIEVRGSELIGMIPKEALKNESVTLNEALERLKLDSVRPFDPKKQVLDYKLEHVQFIDDDHSEGAEL